MTGQRGMSLRLAPVQGRFAVCRLEADAAVPDWAWRGELVSVTRTRDECSIVCQESVVPEGTRAEVGWAALKVRGPLEFSLTGVLAALSVPLARAGISIYALSTYDTDYLLVRARDLSSAVDVLRRAGHQVDDSEGGGAAS